MKELIKEFNKYLIAEHGVILDCNYNKNEMYLIYCFIKRSLILHDESISNYCNMGLIDHLLATIDLGKPETVFQQAKYIEQYTMPE